MLIKTEAYAETTSFESQLDRRGIVKVKIGLVLDISRLPEADALRHWVSCANGGPPPIPCYLDLPDDHWKNRAIKAELAIANLKATLRNLA